MTKSKTIVLIHGNFVNNLSWAAEVISHTKIVAA